MNYWLDLFTGTTWDEFKKDGAKTSGFSSRMRKQVAAIQKGDILVCYMTGVMRWVGALEVLGPSSDKSAIWTLREFPERLNVKPLVMLSAETGVPMSEVEGHVVFYEGQADSGKFKGFLRGSPKLFKRPGDGEYILRLIREAEKTPIVRPVDPAKLARKPLFKVSAKKGKKLVQTLVSVPDSEEKNGETGEPEIVESPATPTEHTRIEHLLLTLGKEMGFDIWVAKNDRSKVYKGTSLGSLPGMVDDLPTQFNEATNRTIELIDVLWLKGNSIVAAFEVEWTTAIYSGLLRMSDLLALQPNLNIKLYIVAPDDRASKVQQEILRPTFTLRERPLAEMCGFLSSSVLTEKIEGVRRLGLAVSLKSDFLEQLAEYFAADE
jgi:hypothetical protein